MSAKPYNLHGTAIRINDLGVLCVGASGSGKSELAFSLIEEAKRCGASAVLIADDQVIITLSDETIVASQPKTTSGLLELRGSGIIHVESEPSVVLTHVITRELSREMERLPLEDERYEFGPLHSLPLIRIPSHSLTPYAKFSAFVAHLCQRGTFAR